MGNLETTNVLPKVANGWAQKGMKFLPPYHLSIRAKLLLSFLLVIFLMASVNVALVVLALDYKSQYDVLIEQHYHRQPVKWIYQVRD